MSCFIIKTTDLYFDLKMMRDDKILINWLWISIMVNFTTVIINVFQLRKIIIFYFTTTIIKFVIILIIFIITIEF